MKLLNELELLKKFELLEQADDDSDTDNADDVVALDGDQEQVDGNDADGASDTDDADTDGADMDGADMPDAPGDDDDN